MDFGRVVHYVLPCADEVMCASYTSIIVLFHDPDTEVDPPQGRVHTVLTTRISVSITGAALNLLAFSQQNAVTISQRSHIAL